jgi:hypothetical protein
MGFLQNVTVTTMPKFKKEKRAFFMNGTSKKKNLVLNILLKHSDCILEKSGCYSLFAHHVAEKPNNGEITKLPPFLLNKIKSDAMLEILNKYIKRGIVETSTSAWNACADLVKRQQGLVGKLQYCVLPYGWNHSGQIFKLTIDKDP